MLLLQLGKLLGNFRPIRADFPMVTEFATLSEVALAQVALERFLTCVRIFVLFSVLLQAERFCAEATLEILLRIVLLIVPLKAELSLECSCATVDITLEDGQTFLTIISILLHLKRARATRHVIDRSSHRNDHILRFGITLCGSTSIGRCRNYCCAATGYA